MLVATVLGVVFLVCIVGFVAWKRWKPSKVTHPAVSYEAVSHSDSEEDEGRLAGIMYLGESESSEFDDAYPLQTISSGVMATEANPKAAEDSEDGLEV